MEIHRFGSECLETAADFVSAASILRGHPTAAIAVAALCPSIAEPIDDALDAVAAGDTDAHHAATAALLEWTVSVWSELSDHALPATLEHDVALIGNALAACATLGEVSERTRARIRTTAARLNARLLLRAIAQPEWRLAEPENFLETDASPLQAEPLAGLAQRSVRRYLLENVKNGQRFVVPGAVGMAPDSTPVWLGTGGADYTATFIAGALSADRVVLWNSVPGLFSADPAIVNDARPLEQLNYREAAELSFYAHDVLHPRALNPLKRLELPVEVRGFRDTTGLCTRIDARLSPGDLPAKIVSAVRGQTLIAVEGRGIAGRPQISSRLFETLSAEGIIPTMISQASSQASICVAVAGPDAKRAEVALKRTFRMEISHGDVEEVTIQPNVSLVALIGIGMAHSPGIAGRMFSSLGDAGVNVLAIAQGSSELNITVAVLESDTVEALHILHRRFALGVGTAPTGMPAIQRSPSPSPRESARVFAPATVANVGPGFDVLGLALQGKGDTVVAERVDGDEVVILEVTGDDGRLPLDARSNTAGIAAIETLRRAGVRAGIGLRIHKGMPIGSGLGSSAASAAAAAVATNILLGSPLRRIQLVEACVEAETAVAGRHADNVAPAVLGGLILVRSVDPLDIQRLPVPEGLLMTVVTPDFELSTRLAREALPKHITIPAMVRNSANIATLVTACYAGDLGLLAGCVVDDVVTPARAVLIPGAVEVMRAAERAGALASSISGSGPSIFAMCHGPEIARRVGLAMQQAFRDAGLESSLLISAADCPGATRC